jgi:hypothetical protein
MTTKKKVFSPKGEDSSVKESSIHVSNKKLKWPLKQQRTMPFNAERIPFCPGGSILTTLTSNAKFGQGKVCGGRHWANLPHTQIDECCRM